MKTKPYTFLIVTLIFILPLTGCLDIITDTTITYEKHPTTISYTLTYGYLINCTGQGKYELFYTCDLPEIIQGSLSYELFHTQDYTTAIQAQNQIIQWNITDTTNQQYNLGISTTVTAQTFLTTDLNGNQALSLQEIQQEHPHLIEQYCTIQANDTTTLIDPTYQPIQNTAQFIQNKLQTNNSYLLAKQLFIWLKENTVYQTHPINGGVQPSAETFQKKTGDCDDLSFLYIALCRSLNIPARYIRGYLLKNESNTITATSHAWAEVYIGESIGNNGWLPVECACSCTTLESDIHQNFGIEDAFHLRLFVDDGSNESIAKLYSGISYRTYHINRDIQITPFTEITNYKEQTYQKLIIKNNRRYYQ